MTRVAIIGSGFAQAHVDAIKQIPEVELVAVCSRNELTARALIDQSGNENADFYPFENYREMLRSERLDAVYCTLPPFLHGELEIVCSEHVPALFIEKPVALDIETAAEMAQAFRKAGTIVSVGYMNRYRSNLQAAQAYFKQRPAILFGGGWCGNMPGPYWWRRKELSGGQLTEQCTHIIDAVRFLGGEFREVQAMAIKGFAQNYEDQNVEEAMVMNFLLESGAVGSLQTSCFAESHRAGSTGIELSASSREKAYRFSKHKLDLNVHHSADRVECFLSQENPVLLENEAFIHAVKTGDQSRVLSHFDDAILTLKVSLAADRSLRERRTVSLSEFS